MKIEDPKKVADIFESLEFVKASKVIKKRTIYNFEQYIISLDDVVGLEPYMEIETGIEEGNEYKAEIDKIFELFKKLNINEGFERTSYLELLDIKREKN